MKKIALILAIATLSTTLLAGCGKFVCESCERETDGKKYKIEEDGEKLVVCEDCNSLYEAAKAIQEAFENL